jgi:hypothetical protein
MITEKEIPEEQKKYYSALKKFVGDDELRPALQKPFIQEDYVIATDAYTIICFNKSKVSSIEIINEHRVPNA